MAGDRLDPLERGALRLLQENIRVKLNELADQIALGEVKDWPEYQRMVGRIEGYGLAERELLDIVERFERNNN